MTDYTCTPAAAYTPRKNSSYKPKASTGQTYYDSTMHLLGYDATIVGSSAVFFLLFQALRFMLGSCYWEQVAEYNAAPVEARFDRNHITDAQRAQSLSEHSTPEEVLEKGFLPMPTLAQACALELQNLSAKMGGSSHDLVKDEGATDLLERNLVIRPK